MKAKKQIKYSGHAEAQLQEGNIKKEMVKDTLLKPQQVILGKRKRKIAQRIYTYAERDFLHRVVFLEYEDCFEVITTYVTIKIEKYWRA